MNLGRQNSPKRARDMRSGEGHDLISIGPYERAGARCADFLNRIAQVSHQPSAVAGAGDALSSGITEPTNPAAMSMPPEAARHPLRRIKVIIEPVHFFAKRYAPPIVEEMVMVKNFKGAVKEAKLRPALRIAYGRYKPQIHQSFPRVARAFQSCFGRVRGGAPQISSAGRGWSLVRHVHDEKHATLFDLRINVVALRSVSGGFDQPKGWKHSVRLGELSQICQRRGYA